MKISIGICAYNEENNIGRLLENLISQNFPTKYELVEIIVVASGCTDQTVDIVRRIARKEPRITLIVEKERRGKPRALNKIFQVARGDLLFLISADVYPTQGSLAKLAESLKENVGGADARAISINPDESPVDFASRFLWRLHNEVLSEETRMKRLTHLAGDMFVIRRGIVDHVPEDIINDDAYIGIALKKKGWQVIHVPEAVVYIMTPRTVVDYVRQRERVIIGHRQLNNFTGVCPTTLGAMLFRNPLYSFRIFLRGLKHVKARDYPKVAMVVYLEIVARILASINYRNRAKYITWKRVSTTKTLNLRLLEKNGESVVTTSYPFHPKT